MSDDTDTLCSSLLQVSVIRLNDLRTPAVLLAATLIGYLLSGLLATLSLDLLSHAAQLLTYCILALLVSWLLLRYGNGSDDVISAIDRIADFLFATVCNSRSLTSRDSRLIYGTVDIRGAEPIVGGMIYQQAVLYLPTPGLHLFLPRDAMHPRY